MIKLRKELPVKENNRFRNENKAKWNTGINKYNR